MLVKAACGFCGEICMAPDEVRDVPQGAALTSLLQAGYVCPAEAPQETPKEKKPRKKKAKEDDAP